jgi:hypothetical protein
MKYNVSGSAACKSSTNRNNPTLPAVALTKTRDSSS